MANHVYIDGKPAWTNFDEGRVVYKPNGTCFIETYLKDHLGNIRVAYGNDGNGFDLRQIDSYYPFGMTIRGLSHNLTSALPKNEYLYNGKMYQDELGLNWYDYGARFYDPVVGRWWSMDPACEDGGQELITPYCYVINDPIKHNDPDGRFPFVTNIIGAAAGAVTEYAGQVVANSIRDGGFRIENLYKDIDLLDIGVSTVEGAITSGGSVIKGLTKAGVVVGSEIARNALDGNFSEGITTNKASETVKILQSD